MAAGFSRFRPQNCAPENFSATGTVLYDPRTGTANGTGRVPFAFANCPGVTSTSDARFAGCNYIPADRINAISKRLLDELPLPELPGYTSNYYTTDTNETNLPQDRFEGHMDTRQQAECEYSIQLSAKQ